MGDLVHLAAKPVVGVVKAVTGGAVDLGRCGGCAQRRERWNAAMPFGRPPEPGGPAAPG
jgi:hypothetical protein